MGFGMFQSTHIVTRVIAFIIVNDRVMSFFEKVFDAQPADEIGAIVRDGKPSA